MTDEKEFYLPYLNKNVRIIRRSNNFFYQGIITHVLDDKLILMDKKTGQVIFGFDEIKLIELTIKND